MTSLKKLRKQKRPPAHVSRAIKLITYINKLQAQKLLIVKNKAIYIYRVLLTLGQNPDTFKEHLYLYAIATGLINSGDKLQIIDIETDEILN